MFDNISWFVKLRFSFFAMSFYLCNDVLVSFIPSDRLGWLDRCSSQKKVVKCNFDFLLKLSGGFCPRNLIKRKCLGITRQNLVFFQQQLHVVFLVCYLINSYISLINIT